MILAEIDIPSSVLRTGFDAQPRTFQEAQSGAQWQFGMEAVGGVIDLLGMRWTSGLVRTTGRRLSSGRRFA